MMVRRALGFAVAFSMTGCSGGSQAAAPEFASRTGPLTDCKPDEESAGFDVVGYRCEGLDGIPVWWRYADSARLYVGFGERRNDLGFFGIDADAMDRALEWRGVETAEGFIAHAVIAQLPSPLPEGDGSAVPDYTVFRLRDDGTSCILARNIESDGEARAIADAGFDRFECVSEPHVYD